MSNNTSGIELEFEVLDSFEYKGVQIKKGKIRKIKNKDIIAINKDISMQQLAKRSDVDESSHHPMIQAMTNSVMTECFCFLLSKLVTVLGDGDGKYLEQVDRKVFEEFTQTDMSNLVKIYGEMNQTDVKDILKTIGGQPTPAETAASPLSINP